MIRFFQARRQALLAFSLTAFIGLAMTGTALAEEFSDGKLKSFATALNSINQLAERWKPQVEAATSEDQANALINEFEVEVSQVIENTDGIVVAEYEEIVQAAQSDPALTDRIVAMVQEVQGQ